MDSSCFRISRVLRSPHRERRGGQPKISRRHRLIYTDLDATFLDGTSYSYCQSLPALRAAQSAGIDVVFCSSKTAAEIESLIQELGVSIPYIAENGGGIWLPESYLQLSSPDLPLVDGSYMLTLGRPYQELVQALREVRSELGLTMRGFSDMSCEEVARICEMSTDGAKLAKERQFDEPFIAELEEEGAEMKMRAAFSRRDLRVTRGGRFFHITGDNDKGMAVAHLNRLYQRRYGDLLVLGVGDSANDLPMLKAVDQPALVQKPDGSYDTEVLQKLPCVKKVPGIGPAGWLRVVMDFVDAE